MRSISHEVFKTIVEAYRKPVVIVIVETRADVLCATNLLRLAQRSKCEDLDEIESCPDIERVDIIFRPKNAPLNQFTKLMYRLGDLGLNDKVHRVVIDGKNTLDHSVTDQIVAEFPRMNHLEDFSDSDYYDEYHPEFPARVQYWRQHKEVMKSVLCRLEKYSEMKILSLRNVAIGRSCKGRMQVLLGLNQLDISNLISPLNVSLWRVYPFAPCS